MRIVLQAIFFSTMFCTTLCASPSVLWQSLRERPDIRSLMIAIKTDLIFKAIDENKIAHVKQLIEQEPALRMVRNNDKQLPLVYALKRKRLAIARVLRSHVSAAESQPCSQPAVKKETISLKEPKIFQLIDSEHDRAIVAQASLEAFVRTQRNRHGETPLLYALRCNKTKSILALVDRGVALAMRALGSGERCALRDPAFKKEFAKGYRRLGQKLHEQSVIFAGPLARRFKKQEKIVTLILENSALVYAGTYVRARFFPDEVPENEHWPSVGYDRALVDTLDAILETALPDLVPLVQKLLIWYMPDLYLPNKRRSTPLMLASKGGFYSLVRLILALETDVNAGDEYSMNPLLYAALHGQTKVVGLLLDAGADPDVRDALGATPLSLALGSGARGCAELLLAAGARTDGLDVHGSGVLMVALHGIGYEQSTKKVSPSHGLQFIRRLLATDAYAHLNTPDITGLTPLMQAVTLKRNDIMRELIINGACVGDGSLLHAINQCNIKQVDLLLRNGAQIQDSALGFALFTGDPSLVYRLVAAGARLNKQDAHAFYMLINKNRGEKDPFEAWARVSQVPLSRILILGATVLHDEQAVAALWEQEGSADFRERVLSLRSLVSGMESLRSF